MEWYVMALQTYITIADVRNKTFQTFSDPTKQIYVDLANDELEDLAKRKGVSDLTTIAMPIHHKLKEFCIHYAVQQLALDNANFNNKDALSVGEDKYNVLYQRESYALQEIHKGVTLIMFTGGAETPTNRAVLSQRLERR